MDDAVGEAFDKTAKMLGLPYPGGPGGGSRRQRGNPRAYPLPRPLLGRRTDADFSFSGLKTAVRQLAQDNAVNVDDACASFQAAVIDILRDRTTQPWRISGRISRMRDTALVVAGGVAANAAIGSALAELAESTALRSVFRPPGSAPTMRR